MRAGTQRPLGLARWRLAAVACGVALLAAACGEAATGDTNGARQPGGQPNGASAGEEIDEGVGDLLAYVGGEAGPADESLSPITIGWVNVEGTALGTPEATVGAEAAVTYINSELGGIGGHPLALKTCEIAAAEEEGQRCGQEMLNDDSVAAVAFGSVFVGDQAFNAVMAGQKPVLVSVAIGPSVTTAENTYVLFGDLAHVFGPWGTYARDVLGAETAALLYTDNAADRIASGAVRKGLEDAGLEVQAVAFDPQATDLIGPATAAGVQTADVIVPISSGRGCVGIARALEQLGVTAPVVSTPICLSPDVAEGVGGDLPQWTYGVAQTLASDEAAADARAFVEAATSAGVSAEDQDKVWTAASWSLMLVYAKLMNEIGPDQVAPDTVAQALADFTGPVVVGAPEVSCGKYPDAIAVCNDRARFYQYEGQGNFVPLTGWLRPPA